MSLIDDLNYLIRYFSTSLSENIQSIEKENTSEQQLCPQIQTLVQKYTEYKLQQQTEIQMIKKMSMRLLQIFFFFKNKSKYQSTLSHLQRELKNRLKILTNQADINLCKIIKLIVSISHRKIIPNYRNISFIQPILSSSAKKRKTIESRVTSKQTIKSISQKNLTRKNKSLINCKVQLRKSKYQAVQTILSIYNCMHIQKSHLLKCLQNRQECQKQQLKRNQSVIKKLKDTPIGRAKAYSHKKFKTEQHSDQTQFILGQLSSSNKAMNGIQGRKKRSSLRVLTDHSDILCLKQPHSTLHPPDHFTTIPLSHFIFAPLGPQMANPFCQPFSSLKKLFF